MKMGLLDKFYKNIDRWSFAFQMNCFISRAQQVDKLPEGINFIERSILSDNIFATNCYENGNMDKLEYEIYRKWSKWLYNKVCKEVKNVIYLRSTPEVSYERIKKRNRDSEDEIPLEYLRALHKLHDDWLIDNENINVVVIDADKLILDDNIIELLKLSFLDTR